jgi:branched-chain amino acid transport system permease protein
MKPMQIAMALSAVMFFILAGVFMGVQLELDGTKLVVDTAADIRWQWILSAPRWSFSSSCCGRCSRKR